MARPSVERWVNAQSELLVMLSRLLPRKPAVDPDGRAQRAADGALVYPPFVVSEEEYGRLVSLVNEVREGYAMNPIKPWLGEDGK